MLRSRPIDGKLRDLQIEIEGYARHYGLDFFDQIFEMCDYDTINILAAQGGFPSRYPHWKFGMDYDQMSKGYAYGLQKIYEMVINTDPCYAYLLEVNNWVDQKIVMAHVYGHNDFFKNNAWFAHTDRKMMDSMANHGAKIRRFMNKHGQDRVEQLIDRIQSLENLLNVDYLFENPETRRRREEIENQYRFENSSDFFENDDRSDALKSFMRSKKRRQDQQDELDEKNNGRPVRQEAEAAANPIETPRRDILRFLMNFAPLEEWEIDVIGILRAEAYYYLPQRMTKIMNEGWASYWHSTIMTRDALDASEIVDFADKHAGVMQMSRQQMNPYKVGIELMRDIEYRWNTGRFGKDYNECESMTDKEQWDTKLNQGREKIFEVRRTHNDITFIDEFLTPEFCQRQQMFTYKFNPRTHRYEIDSRDFEAIKSKLLIQLTNFGSPVIEVTNANYENRSELLLEHRHDGVDLDVNYAAETLKNLNLLWKRPVNLLTQYEEKNVIFRHDGKEFRHVV